MSDGSGSVAVLDRKERRVGGGVAARILLVRGCSGAMLGILIVEAGAARPERGLISVSGNAVRVLERPREVQHVPGHERRVAGGEVVLGPARSWV